MILWMVIGGAIGLAAGALFGSLVKRPSLASPPTNGPWSGALIGFVAGAAIGYVFWNSFGHTEPESYLAIPLVQSPQEFDRIVRESNRPVVVDFFATWCGPCKELAPTLGKLAEEYQGRVSFYRVDGDKSPDLMQAYDIKGYPTVVILWPSEQGRKGELRWVGLNDESAYRAGLERALTETRRTATSTGASMDNPLHLPEASRPAPGASTSLTRSTLR